MENQKNWQAYIPIKYRWTEPTELTKTLQIIIWNSFVSKPVSFFGLKILCYN